jgi:aldehyde:ferredoxin oxidoreductase
MSSTGPSEDRLLCVDMALGTTVYEQFPDEWRLLGGRALLAKILLQRCDPACDPLGSDNVLVMAPGVLSGTAMPTSGRISFGCKSPLTGGIKEANAGGEPGQDLMKLGIRAIIVRGKPADKDRRFGLEIAADGARLVAADAHRYKWNYPLCEDLCGHYPKSASFICIGPAGEWGLKGASIACTDRETRVPARHAARGGVGGVMGSKGLKFVAIDPGKARLRQAADAKGFSTKIKSYTRSWQSRPNILEIGTSGFVDVANALESLPTNNRAASSNAYAGGLHGSGIAETFESRGGGMHNCMTGCIVQCSNRVHDREGNYKTSALEFETLALLGSNCGIESWEEVADLDRLSDDIGVDTIEIGATIAVYMDAGKMEFGDHAGMKRLFEEIANGSELGKMIGNGADETGRQLSHHRIPTVKGQAIAAWEPRTLHATGMTYATSPQGADHTAGVSMDASVPPDKLAKTSQLIQTVVAGVDSSGCCTFLGTTLDDLRELYGYLYSIEVSRRQIADMSWQVLVDEWEFNRRAGFTADDDRLPKWMSVEGVGPNHAVFDVPAEIIQSVYERIDHGDELFTHTGVG